MSGWGGGGAGMCGATCKTHPYPAIAVTHRPSPWPSRAQVTTRVDGHVIGLLPLDLAFPAPLPAAPGPSAAPPASDASAASVGACLARLLPRVRTVPLRCLGPLLHPHIRPLSSRPYPNPLRCVCQRVLTHLSHTVPSVHAKILSLSATSFLPSQLRCPIFFSASLSVNCPRLTPHAPRPTSLSLACPPHRSAAALSGASLVPRKDYETNALER